MNIGSVRPVEGKNGFLGTIATLTLDMTIALVPVDSDNERAPKFEVRARNAAKRWVRVGALWEKASEQDGVVYLTGSLDDPALPSRVFIAGFHQQDGSISIVWSRPERQDEMRGGKGKRATRESDPFQEPASADA